MAELMFLELYTALARKRRGDAEIGWRPAPEKNIEAMPCWGNKEPGEIPRGPGT